MNNLDAFLNEFPEIGTELIMKIIKTADKYDVDKDTALKVFQNTFSAIVNASTFKNFKIEENENDEQKTGK